MRRPEPLAGTGPSRVPAANASTGLPCCRVNGAVSAELLAALAATTLPADGLLRHPGEGILRSAFFGGLITAILLAFLVPGLAYGIAVGTIRSDKDVVKQMISSMGTMATYIVLVFFAARVSRPIHELTSGLSELAAGNFETRIPTPRKDEIGYAIRAFNNTAEQLAAQRARLVYLTQLASWQALADGLEYALLNGHGAAVDE